MTHNSDPDPRPRAEGFEVFETGADALTPEERSWPVVALDQREHSEFAELEEVPVLEVTLLLADPIGPEARTDPGLDDLIATCSRIDVAAGGKGYRLGDRWAERDAIILTLIPEAPAGAAARIDALRARLAECAVPGVRRIAARAA